MRSLTKTCRILIGGALVAMAAGLPMAAQAANADLQITLVDPPSVFHYGETQTYTLDITNLGPSVAEGVEIKAIDVVAPLVLVSVSGCTPVTVGTPVPCTVGNGEVVDDVPPATPTHNKTVTFDVQLPMPTDGLPTTCPDGSGLAAVSATVGLASDSTTTDPSLTNNTVTSDVPTIGTFADLGIEMTAPATANIGDTITITATVTNNGPCPAPDVLADDEQFLTTLTLEFVSADGACSEDPLNGTCDLGTLAPDASVSWNVHYKVLDFPPTLMQSGEPVSLTVFRNPDAAADPIDTNSSNDSAVTQTIVKKSVGSGCSTGGMGGALGLLVLAVPFLRRRRKG